MLIKVNGLNTAQRDNWKIIGKCEILLSWFKLMQHGNPGLERIFSKMDMFETTKQADESMRARMLGLDSRLECLGWGIGEGCMRMDSLSI